MNLTLICLVLVVLCVNLSSSVRKSRIVGGKRIEIEDAPYQVSLRLLRHHFCGGALISDIFVLSAAHCAKRSLLEFYDVRVGSSASRYGGVLVNVIDVHQHPLYESTFDYDFSILQLERVQLPSSVGFVKLPSFFDTTIAGELTFVSGWGDTKNDNESLHFLRGVEVPVADFNKCQEAYSKMRLAVTDRMICAGYSAGGFDACQGDSGGPMVRRIDGVLIGIVSWGFGCALPGYPGVYSKVSSFRSFISNITNI